MFQMPCLVCNCWWHGTASPSTSPTGWASLAEVSPPVRMIFCSAKYSHALRPKPGSPEMNVALRLARSSADSDSHSLFFHRSPWPVY